MLWWTVIKPPSGNVQLMTTFKAIVHLKMLILWSFTHPHVVQNLYEFVSYVEHKRRYILQNAGNQTVLGPDFHREINTIEVNGDQQHFGSSKYLLLCST